MLYLSSSSSVIVNMYLFILIFVLPTLAHAYSGKIGYVRGEVTIISKGKSTLAQKDSSVSSGDTVKTASRSLTIIAMDDGVVFKMNPKSELAIPVKNDNSVTLNAGSVFSKVSKQKPNQQFKLRTPSAVIGVRGTEFFTSYGQTDDKKSDIWMCVNEGSVEVTSVKEKNSVVVKEGEGVVIPSGKGVTPPKKYAWTKKLNWNLEPSLGEVENNVQIKYENILKEDYD